MCDTKYLDIGIGGIDIIGMYRQHQTRSSSGETDTTDLEPGNSLTNLAVGSVVTTNFPLGAMRAARHTRIKNETWLVSFSGGTELSVS